jgi:hypothetical protein
MDKRSRHLLIVCLWLYLAAHFSVGEAAVDSSACEPKSVGKVLSEGLGMPWNEGTVRAWDQRGEFWSVPLRESASRVSALLKEKLIDQCYVEISDLHSFSARITPKTAGTKGSLSDAPQKSRSQNDRSIGGHIISSAGTTIGIFAPSQGEIMMIMYSAKIAAAMAKGSGKSQQIKLKETLRKFSQELDIEYNFGDISVVTVGGVAKLSMREAGDAVFSDIRSLGYQILPSSVDALSQFDGVFPPDRHESFWSKPDGVTRVELKKLKHGLVRVSIDETREIRR